MSGAEDGNKPRLADQHNNSISNQYHREGPNAMQRNARTIARAQSFRDDEQNRRREELQRRIEETRRKLQNVKLGLFLHHMTLISKPLIILQIGYRSTMKGSQSISDLSNLPPKEDPLRGGVSGRGERIELLFHTLLAHTDSFYLFLTQHLKQFSSNYGFTVKDMLFELIFWG